MTSTLPISTSTPATNINAIRRGDRRDLRSEAPHGYIAAMQAICPNEIKRIAIDSRADRGAYFSSGGYDPLLAPVQGTVNVSSRFRHPLPKRTSQ